MSTLTLPTSRRKVFVLSLCVRGFIWLVHQKWEENNIFVVASLIYLHQHEKIFTSSTNDLLVVIRVICDTPVSSAAAVWSFAELAFLRHFMGLKAIAEGEERGRFVPDLHPPEGIRSFHLLSWHDPVMISPLAFLLTFISPLNFPPQHTKSLLFLPDSSAVSRVLHQHHWQPGQSRNCRNSAQFPNWQHAGSEVQRHPLPVWTPPAQGSALTASHEKTHPEWIQELLHYLCVSTLPTLLGGTQDHPPCTKTLDIGVSLLVLPHNFSHILLANGWISPIQCCLEWLTTPTLPCREPAGWATWKQLCSRHSWWDRRVKLKT